MSAPLPKVRVLLVVWGETYIDRFAALSLPSVLAPGNLPALSRGSALEFLILTSTAGAAYFVGHPGLAALKRVCPVRFVTIDDLIAAGMYGVTLTLAYTRGVADSGSDMVNTHFLFLNSDFILADGSLTTLLSLIRENRRCILAPSFRAIAEKVEPILERAIDPERGVLEMKPRDMVQIALDHVHPTTIAKVANQGFIHSDHPNQLYWYVDDKTMLGRFFLMFMLCIRPERVVTSVNSYCDYGFVPEMCPTADVHVIADSDVFFMLETQSEHQEGQHLHLGTRSPLQIARSLGEWTTREHRAAATHDLLFHSGNLPASIGAARADADRFVRDVAAHLPKPRSHIDHHYWINGLQAWRQQRRRAKLAASAPELPGGKEPATTSASSYRAPLLRLIPFLLVGARPFLRAWHYDWPDYQILARDIGLILSGENARILVAYDRQTPVGAYFSVDDARIEWTNFRRLPARKLPQPGEEFDCAVCILTPQDLQLASNGLVERVLPLLRDGGEILIVFHNIGEDASPAEPVRDLVDFMSRLPIARMNSVSARFCGGTVKYVVRRAIRSMADLFYRRNRLVSLLASPALAGLLLISVINNLYLARLRNTSAEIDFCSSFALRFRKR